MPSDGYPLTIEGETTGVSTAAELVVALDVLEGRRDREALEQLRPHLAEIIGKPPGLQAVMAVLQPDDQLFLVEALGDRLAEVVATPQALRDLLAGLADDRVEEALLRTLGGNRLRALIRTPGELAGILEWVYGTNDALVLELLGQDFLARLFQTGEELGLVLRAIDAARQEELLAMLGLEGVTALVRDERDLAYLLRALPSAVSRRLLEHFSDAVLTDLIRDECAWRYVQRFLEADELAYLTPRWEAASHAQ
jgi:hypothetical protein